jgi:hypothetical protein
MMDSTPRPTAELPQVAADGSNPGGEPTVIYVREPAGGRWGRRLLLLVGTIGLVIALVFGLKAADLWPQLRNPFATETTDRTGPVLLQSIQNLSQYVAAEGDFQVLVDLQENKRFIPDFIYNERTLFVGVGSVDAYVDFSAINDGAIVVSPDGRSVEITLPAPQLEKPSIDNDRSYVFAQERGLANRLGNLFGSADQNQQLYQLAEQKIAQAAAESELRERAERNTRAMLESLIKGLGYERVTVTFTAP